MTMTIAEILLNQKDVDFLCKCSCKKKTVIFHGILLTVDHHSEKKI